MTTKKMKSLLDIEYEYLEYLTELDEFCAENEIDDLADVPDHIMERLAINKDEMKHKIENYLNFIAELDGENKVLEEQIERLRNKSARKAKTILYLKSMVSQAIAIYGNENAKGNSSITTSTYKITRVRTNPVIVEDIEKLPNQYKRCSMLFKKLSVPQLEELKGLVSRYPEYQDTVEPDKIAIKAALGEGTVAGAKVDTEAAYLRIT